MTNICIDFIQYAIGVKQDFPYPIKNDDWLEIYSFCKKQAVLGIGFSAVEKLHSKGVVCPYQLRYSWMSIALQIENRNKKLNEYSKEIVERYKHDGLSCCILKGQGNLLNYPSELALRRQSGDIDIWCEVNDNGIPIATEVGRIGVEYVNYHGVKAIIEYVKMQHVLFESTKKPNPRYCDLQAPEIDSIPVEVHYRPSSLNSPLRNYRLQRWLKDNAHICMSNETQMGFAVPTTSVNVIYQMTHLYTHYFDGGLGLRQLMDYYFALRVWHNDVMECKDLQSQGMWSEGLGTPMMPKEEVISVLSSFGMSKFTAAVMYVLQEVFAMPTHYYICKPNEKEGKKLLAEIMQGGNFGQYDTRDAALKKGGMMKHGVWKLKRVMRLVRSFPEEALWEPVFRVWHLVWRGING